MGNFMHCDYFVAGQCRSCRDISTPYVEQLAIKQQRFQQQLMVLPLAAEAKLFSPFASREAGFRNKAKMVVQGSAENPILGIIDDQQAIDLTGCGLYPAEFQQAFSHIQDFIRQAKLQPYDVETRKGELKYVLLTSNGSGWLLRFVMRSQNHVAAIKKYLAQWQQQWPELEVCSVNIQSEHKAILEGEQEFVLSSQTKLCHRLNGINLYVQPQSFFQTNTDVAAALYQTARDWTADLPVQRVWDLFCGVGGFALHLASPKRQVTGIEISAPAIACALQSALELGVQIDFRALDADAFAKAASEGPELLVVNPPRRGLGVGLCEQIESLKPQFLLYSSCNPESMQQDLLRLSQYQLRKAQLFDMFPHTAHAEALCLLERISS
jgi:23S rRNA (uracil747-C5)-methyltransferase